ncbi:MAG TPA: P-loop NTPase fold protein, partial [Acidobacteriaceae bacterium]
MMPEYGGDEPSVEASEPAEAGAVISAGSARSSSVSDKAAAEDLLGFKDYVDAIARFLKAPETEAPLTLSIEGEWGSGKSSFLLQLKRALEAGPAPAVVISFNAWRYDKQDELWAAFALHVTRGLREGVSVGRRYWGDLLLFFSRI